MFSDFLGLRAGVPVLKVIDVKDKEDGVTNSFYLVKMTRVEIVSENLKNIESYHLFTKKEMYEASVRYFCDFKESNLSQRCQHVIGYHYPVTYTNRHGALTTRFYTNFDCTHVSNLQNRVYGLLFTAREMRRSIDRVKIHLQPKGFIQRLKGVLMKFTRVLFLAIIACCFSGCFGVVYRPIGEVGGSPYCCTRVVALELADAIGGPIYGTGLYSYQRHYHFQFCFPWLLVDLPCEVVADTLMLPVDLLMDKRGN